MDRNDLIDDFREAMDNCGDCDISLYRYATAAVDRLGWRSLEKEKPADRDMVIATDGKARWIDMWLEMLPQMTWDSHVATHWHPVLDLPVASHLK